ncbi:ATP-binding domain-containing protein, partial [Shewanella sp.]|uniref:ATP-binding domain-containing protein n=1 Tax=Shewanella sp. TaxID=50422 RepID=UPI003D12C3FF
VSALRRHLPAYATTIHKSQGSEFDHVVLVLADISPVLCRELLYTAITRAKGHFTCLGTQVVFEQACRQATLRASGLAKRLWQA